MFVNTFSIVDLIKLFGANIHTLFCNLDLFIFVNIFFLFTLTKKILTLMDFTANRFNFFVTLLSILIS